MASHTNVGLIIVNSVINLSQLKGILNLQMEIDKITQTDVWNGNSGSFELTNSQIIFGNNILGNIVQFPGFGNIIISSKNNNITNWVIIYFR